MYCIVLITLLADHQLFFKNFIAISTQLNSLDRTLKLSVTANIEPHKISSAKDIVIVRKEIASQLEIKPATLGISNLFCPTG